MRRNTDAVSSAVHASRLALSPIMKSLVRVPVALAFACASILVFAQPKDAPYPSKPVRCIVPFPPGGTADIQARMLFERLGPRLGQQIIIDNRGGANGSIGMELAARAPGDGYTIVLATVGTWVINPYLYKLSYRGARFFSHHSRCDDTRRSDRASVAAGQIREGTDRAGEATSRRAYVWIRRHRRLRSHVRRAFLRHDQSEDVARAI